MKEIVRSAALIGITAVVTTFAVGKAQDETPAPIGPYTISCDRGHIVALAINQSTSAIELTLGTDPVTWKQTAMIDCMLRPYSDPSSPIPGP